MKILIVSPTPSHPKTAGNRIRIATMAELMLQLNHDVHFLYYTLEGPETEMLKAFWKEKLHLFSINKLWWRAIKNRIVSLLWKCNLERLIPNSLYLTPIDSWCHSHLKNKVKEVHDKEKFDAVLVEYAFLTDAFKLLPKSVIKIVDCHDKLTNRHVPFLQNQFKPDWFSTSELDEAKALNRADKVIAIQHIEAQFFKSITESPVYTIGINLPFTKVNYQKLNTVGFIASGNEINQRALYWLQTEIWPKVLNQMPNLELIIAGTISPFAKKAPGTVILGMVSDLASAYQEMAVMVNPMQFGTGFKIKSLEAISFGRTLVCTNHAAIGMESAINKLVFTANSTDEFVDAILNRFKAPLQPDLLQTHCENWLTEYNHIQVKNLNQLLLEAP